MTTPDTKEGDYFVDAHDTQSGKTWLILGPFALHVSALKLVEHARAFAEKHDPRAHFLSWGTLRMKKGSGKIGSANRVFCAGLKDF